MHPRDQKPGTARDRETVKTNEPHGDTSNRPDDEATEERSNLADAGEASEQGGQGDGASDDSARRAERQDRENPVAGQNSPSPANDQSDGQNRTRGSHDPNRKGPRGPQVH